MVVVVVVVVVVVRSKRGQADEASSGAKGAWGSRPSHYRTEAGRKRRTEKTDVLCPHHLTARGLILRRSLISLLIYIQTWAFGLGKHSGPRRKI